MLRSHRATLNVASTLRPSQHLWRHRNFSVSPQSPAPGPSSKEAVEKKPDQPVESPPPSGSEASPQAPATSLENQLTQWRNKLRSNAGNVLRLRQRIDAFSATAAATFSRLGGKLNHVTGYEEIESLKQQVVQNDLSLREARRAAREGKKAADDATLQRSRSQREVNDLLQRKSSWTDDDVSRFTQLVRQDHLVEQTEARAKAAAALAEDAVEREFNELMRSILARYHEEQVWSDKIRSVSTYGSLTVMGLNLLVFVLAVILVEPYKRSRIVESVEKRVVEANAKRHAELEDGLRSVSENLLMLESSLAQTLREVQGEVSRSTLLAHPPEPVASEDQEAAAPSRISWFTKDPAEYALIVGGAMGAGAIGWLLRSVHG